MVRGYAPKLYVHVNEPEVQLVTYGEKPQKIPTPKYVKEKQKWVPKKPKTEVQDDKITQTRLLYDVNNYKGNKFINSILFNNYKAKLPEVGQECPSFLKCKEQSDFDFGFILLT